MVMLRVLSILSAYSLARSLSVAYSHLARKTQPLSGTQETFLV